MSPNILHPRKSSQLIEGQIKTLATEYGIAEVDFDPIGPTAIYGDELLRVHAPFYPLIGRRALEKTIGALKLHKRREAVAREVLAHPERIQEQVELTLRREED